MERPDYTRVHWWSIFNYFLFKLTLEVHRIEARLLEQSGRLIVSYGIPWTSVRFSSHLINIFSRHNPGTPGRHVGTVSRFQAEVAAIYADTTLQGKDSRDGS